MKNNLKKVWCEKYRPKTIDEMVLDEDIKDYFKNVGNLNQNILLVGNSGIGKSTLAKIIVNDILKCEYLYINASDENGIDTIRNKVCNFIMSMSLDGLPKVVILDEMDGQSVQAQQALRNLMEEYYDTGFFILTANFNHKIIEPLRSRCASFHLSYDYKDYIKHVAGILKKESVHIDSNTLTYIRDFYPDFRKCLNDLQKQKDNVEHINCKNVKLDKYVDELITSITSKRIHPLRKFIIENESEFSGDYRVLAKTLYYKVCEMDMNEGIKAQTLIHLNSALNEAKSDMELNFFTELINIKLIWSTKVK